MNAGWPPSTECFTAKRIFDLRVYKATDLDIRNLLLTWVWESQQQSGRYLSYMLPYCLDRMWEVLTNQMCHHVLKWRSIRNFCVTP